MSAGSAAAGFARRALLAPPGARRLRDDPWAPLKVAACAVVAGFLDAGVGLLIGVIVGVELARGTSRRLLLLAVGCLSAVLIWNLARGLPSRETVSSLWVLGNPVAHHLAFAGFAFLAVGLVVGPSSGHRTESSP